MGDQHRPSNETKQPPALALPLAESRVAAVLVDEPVVCANCHSPITPEDVRLVYDGDRVCPDCEHVNCNECGVELDRDAAVYTDDAILCSDCSMKALRDSGLLVACRFCGESVLARTAHLHQGRWVGECCWDERLRSSE